MNGWIIIYRKIFKWEWYQKSEMVHLFLHLLLSANHEKGRWQGQDVERGQLITGLKSLNQQTGISVQTIRTCLDKLKSTNEITSKSTNRFRLITILKYNEYQLDPEKLTSKLTSELTNNQQTTNKQLTTNNKNNKNNNISANADPINLMVKELFTYYTEEYSKKITNREKPIFNWGRCHKQAKVFLKTIPLERMKVLVDAYLDSDDKFYKNAAWSLELFLASTTIHSLNIKTK